MNVASLQLCKELYELSGWGYKYHAYGAGAHDLTDKQWYSFEGKRTGSYWEAVYEEFHNLDPFDGRRPTGITHNIELLFPAYDLGYLLRKLPHGYQLNLDITMGGKRIYWLETFDGEGAPQHNDSPEDAACLLAIELLKSGVLTMNKASEVRSDTPHRANTASPSELANQATPTRDKGDTA